MTTTLLPYLYIALLLAIWAARGVNREGFLLSPAPGSSLLLLLLLGFSSHTGFFSTPAPPRSSSHILMHAYKSIVVE